MIPLRDPEAETGHADDFAQNPAGRSTRRRCGPRSRPAGGSTGCAPRLRVPTTTSSSRARRSSVEAGETVTGAPELARLTLNVATAHTDATGSAHGRRLVYGGHTISVAAAHATRAIPAIATIVAWQSCDHLGPVFEGDVLRTELSRARDTSDRRGRGAPRAGERRTAGTPQPTPVLDWSFVAVVA